MMLGRKVSVVDTCVYLDTDVDLDFTSSDDIVKCFRHTEATQSSEMLT